MLRGIMHFGKSICIGLIGLFLITYNAFAEENINREGIWVGIDFGLGHIERSFPETEEEETNAFLGFTV